MAAKPWSAQPHLGAETCQTVDMSNNDFMAEENLFTAIKSLFEIISRDGPFVASFRIFARGIVHAEG